MLGKSAPLFSSRRTNMFYGGNVTVYVSNLDAAVRFYSVTLGLRLAYRFGDQFASVEAGKGLTIGLHPASANWPAGRKGSMAIGLELDGSIPEAVRTLKSRGVRFEGEIHQDKSGSYAWFDDPDGNRLYIVELDRSHVDEGEGQYQGVYS